MKRAILIVTLVMASVGFTKPAMSLDWNALNTTSKIVKDMYLIGIYEGYRAGLQISETASVICLKKGMKNSQLIVELDRFMGSRPEIWIEEIALMAIIGWAKAFPCK